MDLSFLCVWWYTMYMETFCTSFPPICNKTCRVVILGSMPGAASLSAQGYYAHKQNSFWPILFALWDVPLPQSYQEKIRHALLHHVAIWDVIATCTRKGSGDAAIRDATINDFSAFFAGCPDIHTVFHNGKLSQRLFAQHAPSFAAEKRCITLPSTSPAYAVPFADKLSAWQIVRESAERK